MKKLMYRYLVIEDDSNVWGNIERRMEQFENWTPSGFVAELNDALINITEHKPHLIFTDWSIKGGNAYDVLNTITKIENYKPYVIFFTGYQSEHPEIPENIINNYPIVKKYIVKPIYENLTEHLHEYIAEAENQIELIKKLDELWLEDAHRKIHKINPSDWVAFVQSEHSPRLKCFHTKDEKEFLIKYTWKECIAFLKKYRLNYFISNYRKSIINKDQIIRISKPYVWLTDNLKVEVSRDQWHEL